MNKENKKPKIKVKSLGRTIKMLYEFSPAMVIITAVCIVFSAAVSSIPAVFQQKAFRSFPPSQKMKELSHVPRIFINCAL